MSLLQQSLFCFILFYFFFSGREHSPQKAVTSNLISIKFPYLAIIAYPCIHFSLDFQMLNVSFLLDQFATSMTLQKSQFHEKNIRNRMRQNDHETHDFEVSTLRCCLICISSLISHSLHSFLAS